MLSPRPGLRPCGIPLGRQLCPTFCNYGLKANLPKTWQLMQVASLGCIALANPQSSRLPFCARSNARRPRSHTHRQTRRRADRASRTVTTPTTCGPLRKLLKRIGIKRVIFAGPSPHWDAELPKVFVQRLWNAPFPVFIRGLEPAISAPESGTERRIGRQPRSRYVDVMDYFCNRDGCLTYFGEDPKLGLDELGRRPLHADCFQRRRPRRAGPAYRRQRQSQRALVSRGRQVATLDSQADSRRWFGDGPSAARSGLISQALAKSRCGRLVVCQPKLDGWFHHSQTVCYRLRRSMIVGGMSIYNGHF